MTPRRNQNARRLGIFDIDGTVFRSSLLIESFNALITNEVFPKRAHDPVRPALQAWVDRKGHYDDYIMALVRSYYHHLKGKRCDRVEPVIEQVIARQRDRVYRYTRDLIADLRARNYFLIAISNSQGAMVERFARAAGFDDSIGRILEVSRGRYTGKNLVDGKPFPVDVKLAKPELLKHYLREQGMQADLARSIAVGDSEDDATLLSAVGNPIAFNPSFELARIARRRRWSIVVERKDVMYRIHEADMHVARERPRNVRRRRRA